MKRTIPFTPVGKVMQEGPATRIIIEETYRKALKGLDEFSHLTVIWVFDQAVWDDSYQRTPPCYRLLDHELGVFATRGPFRPNAIAMTLCRIIELDERQGSITIDWIDAEPGSPVLDVKPFHPSMDVTQDYSMPSWCSHWPRSREESGTFPWESEFTF